MEFIHPAISGGNESGEKKIEVFCLNNKEEKKRYENLLNDENVNIVEKWGPTFDKIGRALMVVTWEEPT